jgi:3-oxoacyl-[acyl-carrier protein] reductase
MREPSPLFGQLSLVSRHALVCGASAGIGRATALAIASLGATVTVLARRRELLESLLPELLDAGATDARLLVADLDDRDRLTPAIETLLRTHGPVHVLVNNSGGPPGGRLLEARDAEFEAAIGRILLASHRLVQLVLPGMQSAGFGRIVNILSLSVREPIPHLGVGNTVRGAMAAWSKTLAMELPPGITINNVLPGYTATERLWSLADSTAAREGTTRATVEAAWVRDVPEGRLGEPREIAAAVAFLVSPAAAYVRGQNLVVDGGRIRSI